MLAMKSYKMGFKFFQWEKDYNVKFYKSTKQKIKSLEKEVAIWENHNNKEYSRKKLIGLRDELKKRRALLAKTKKFLIKNDILPKEKVKKPKKAKAAKKAKAPARKAKAPAKKRLKISKASSVHIGRKRQYRVPDWSVKELRSLAKAVKKRKCPPGYSKLSRKDLTSWLKKFGARK